MTTITVNTNKPYKVLVGGGLLSDAGTYCREINRGERALLITDSNVEKLYSQTAVESLNGAGFKTDVFVFAAGEPSKRIETVADIYTRLAASGLTRQDLIVALGGGVTGDIAGFAAATWLRGIDYVQIPTTLLAQVDSSVGGKTGVDIPQGKNLVGAFRQPASVIADTDVLSTLPGDVFAGGMAEVIKSAAICDEQLFELLENADVSNKGQLAEIISRCVDIKRRVVELDEHEKGERKLLNFGHTLGHALERHHDYKNISHGYAVSVGMSVITTVSEIGGLSEKGTARRLESLLTKFGLPTIDCPLGKYLHYTALDKKRAGPSIDLVLLRHIGQAFIKTIDIEQLPSFLSHKPEVCK